MQRMLLVLRKVANRRRSWHRLLRRPNCYHSPSAGRSPRLPSCASWRRLTAPPIPAGSPPSCVGKAKNAQRSIKWIGKVMPVFKGEASQSAKGVASRKLWHALHAVDKYLRGQAAWLVNYAKRHRAGLRVGTSITEGTANFLVNRRMNKSQQMRWSRKGADLLLQVRCAVYNGMLGDRFGDRFDRIPDAAPAFAKAG